MSELQRIYAFFYWFILYLCTRYELQKKMMMKKKIYQTPAIRVFVLRQRKQLLEGSGVQAERSGYHYEGDETWE